MLEKLKNARVLARISGATRRLVSERGEANSTSMANEVIALYRQLNDAQRQAFFAHLAEKFNPDPALVLAAAKAYAEEPSATRLLQLGRVAEPPRQELLRRLNRAPGATATIVEMRQQLLKLLDKHPEWVALDDDLHHLLSSWFNPGFLKMHQVDWRSPAELLEKIIQHEAVHEIDGWDDLRRRLQPDRRCFAFFHDQLPGEPLIFVEVALTSGIADRVGPLVDKKSLPLPSSDFKAAVFYSISNCQPGLRGVSLGNFLIKRVAERLKADFPGLKTFVTLSPIPGFMDWLNSGAALGEQSVRPAWQEKLNTGLKQLNLQEGGWAERVSRGWTPESASEADKATLLSLCAIYLSQFSPHRKGNSVAKFHLGNGAKLYRINWAADLSRKGLRQSAGLMANYLYDLDSVEENHERFIKGEVIYSRAVGRLI
jgi:malonyl-CoA decarboxylase